jgi:23S rRNA pseudouridine1911/1915/1917 synthase
MQEFTFTVTPEQAGRRLDTFLADSLKTDSGISRTQIQALIADRLVVSGGVPLTKKHEKVKAGDVIVVHVREHKQTTLEPENIPLEIVFQDEDLAVVNKPAGLVVHPGAGNRRHTLVSALLYHLKTLSDIDPERPGIVHRLDKETSGLLVVARNNAAHMKLSEQFEEHSIRRVYVAVVSGIVQFDEHVIELPLGRDPRNHERMAVSFAGSDSRFAKTAYKTISRSARNSLIELYPFTGRTHQLRVHLAHIGHPILGDTKYGTQRKFSRMALHARDLGFRHPRTGSHIECTSPVPPEFAVFLGS